MPGMTANVTIYTAEKDSALLLPVKALKFIPDTALLADYVIESAVRRTREPRKDTTGTTFKSTARVGSSNYVWILRGDSLVQKHIRTGLNDNTHIEVLSGLTANDVVVMSTNGVSGVAEAGGTKSPFLPNMRRGRRR